MTPLLKLKIDNSVCSIENVTAKQMVEIKDLLSYEISASARYFSGSFAPKRTLLSKRGEFPTGLLYLVKGYLAENRLDHEIKDLRVRPRGVPGLFSLKLPYTPYPEQVAAADACSVLHRGIVVAPTGVGKSVVAALIINALQVRTLIVVPTLELKRQLTGSLAQTFTPQQVGPLSDSKPIVVENVDALNTKKELTGYDCVIIDEFHHSGAKTYRKLNKKAWAGVYFKFGLTATPFRSQDNERLLLESVLSKVIYQVTYQTAVEKGFIVPMEAYYVELPKAPTKAFTWPEVYSDLIVYNDARNKLIHKILSTFHANKCATLCLVKEIAHGRLLSDASGAGFAHGEAQDTEWLIGGFNSGAITCLIGTTGVLGEGIDTRPTEYVIIAGLGKSKNQFMQQVGRAFRRHPGKESCKVILFKDPSHKYTLSHFKAQVKHLKEEYGIKPVKLDLDSMP